MSNIFKRKHFRSKKKIHSYFFFQMDSTPVIINQMRTFQAFGMLPGKDSTYLYTLWGIITFFLAGIGLITCQALSFFYVHSTNDLINELLLFSTTSTIAIKIILFNSKRKPLMNMLDIVKAADERIESDEDINTMKYVHTYCRRITIFYLFCYIGSLPPLFFQLIFLDRTERTWKSTALIPYEFAQQPQVFYSVLIFQAIGNTFNCIIACTLDTFNFLIISLLCGHIEVFSLHLKQIGNSKKQSNRLQLLQHMRHYNLLTECVFCLKNIKFYLI